MKQLVVALSLVALLACGGSLDPEAARAALESKGYSVDLAGMNQAVVARETELISYFIQAGVDPNDFDNEEDAPLLIAARKLDLPTVKLLVESGASAERLSRILHAPAARGYVELLEPLIDAGAPLEGVDQLRQTALMVATDNGHEEAVQLLLSRGADANGPPRGDRRQNRPLVSAAANGNVELIQQLLEHGADIEKPGGRPLSSPLTAAARHGRIEAVDALLAAGAEKSEAAAQAAQRAGFDELAAKLR